MAVALPLVGGLLAGQPLLGVAASIGAQPVGFASRLGVYRTRVAAMLLTALGMAFSAFVGSVTGGHAVENVLAAGVWGLAFGLLASLGSTATMVGINSCIALAIFSQFQYGPGQAALVAALVFAGGVLQTLLLVLVWPLQGFSAERRVLASAYRALADYAANITVDELVAPDPNTFATLKATLADPQPFARRGESVAFEVLLDEAERIRGMLGALTIDRYTLTTDGRVEEAATVATLGITVQSVLAEIAAALAGDRVPQDDGKWRTLDRAMAALDATAARRTAADAQALLGQLRAAWRAAQAPERGAPADPVARRPSRLFATPFSEAFATLRANCSLESEFAQHAIRLSAALMLATGAAHGFKLDRGYWAPLTLVLVLRPDFSTTFSRGVARIIGTLLGALLASSIVALFHPGPIAYLIFTVAFVAISYVVFDASYALFTVAITGYVVFLLAFGGLPEHRALLDRIYATLVGGTLALVAYAVWPTWSRELVPARLAEMLERQRTYVQLLFVAALDPPACDERAIHTAQLAVWLARTNAEVSVDRLVNEPVRPKGVSVHAALGILAASRRLGLAALALRAHLPLTAVDVPRDRLAALVAALDGALAILATALRERTDPPELPPLRDLHVALAKSIAADRDDAAELVWETDVMVDAVNTMADVLHRLHETE